MDSINGYVLNGKLKNDNSGYARWGFASRGKNTYFIKEFLSPIYPTDETELSAKQVEQKRAICTEFYEKKRKFYNVLGKCATGNIVVVSDFFRCGSKYYIITEKINAAPIAPNDIAKMSGEQKLLIMKIILYCVKALHEHNIVHGDIKPDNILFKKTAKGMFTAKIIDFDSSFVEDDPPGGDDLQGDMIYLAPESFLVIAGEECRLTKKIDVFALGVLFHQYLCGELPAFDESEYNYTFEAVLDGSEIKISDKLGSRFANLIKRMLDKDPDKRPSVTEIFDELTKTDADRRSKSKPAAVSSGLKSTVGKSKESTVKETPSFFRKAGDL